MYYWKTCEHCLQSDDLCNWRNCEAVYKKSKEPTEDPKDYWDGDDWNEKGETVTDKMRMCEGKAAASGNDWGSRESALGRKAGPAKGKGKYEPEAKGKTHEEWDDGGKSTEKWYFYQGKWSKWE